MFLAALSGGLVLPLFSLFVETLDGSFVIIGLVIFGRDGASAFSRLLFGSLSDRWGRKPLLITSALGYVIAPLAFSVIDRATYLLPFAVLQGLAISCIWTTAYAIVSDISKVGKRGQAIGLFFVLTGSGFALGTVLGGFLSKSYGFSITYRIAFVLGLIVFLGSLGFRETHHEKTIQTSSRSKKQNLINFANLLKHQTLLIPFIAGFACSLTLAMSSTFFPLYGVQVGRTEAEIGFILMLTPMFGIIVGIPLGKLADIVNKTTLLFITIMSSLLLVALIPLFTSFYAFVMVFSFLSFPFIAIQVIPMAIVADSPDVSSKGLGLGVVQTGIQMGGAISPLLFSLLAGSTSVAYTFWISSLIGLILLGIMIPIAKRSRST